MVSLDPRHHSEEWQQKCQPVGLWHNDLAIFGADLLSDVDASDGVVIDDVNKVVQTRHHLTTVTLLDQAETSIRPELRVTCDQKVH